MRSLRACSTAVANASLCWASSPNRRCRKASARSRPPGWASSDLDLGDDGGVHLVVVALHQRRQCLPVCFQLALGDVLHHSRHLLAWPVLGCVQVHAQHTAVLAPVQVRHLAQAVVLVEEVGKGFIAKTLQRVCVERFERPLLQPDDATAQVEGRHDLLVRVDQRPSSLRTRRCWGTSGGS